jgi:hypothetical protein
MAATKKLRVPVVVGLVVVLGAIFAAFLWFRVCDEQLTSGGQVVTVCRHTATTDPPVVVLGVLALVLLSVFYAEISGFGITLKHAVAEIDRRTKDNERTANALEETVGDLTDFNRERILAPRVENSTPGRVPDDRIVDLAKRYNTLRWTRPSGWERTHLMTDVSHELRRALRDATDFDVLGHLRHDDRGVRLAAYAYLQDHAAPDLVAPLVAAATDEEKPFGQYSALLAVRYQLDTGARLAEQDRHLLRSMRDRIGSDSDRGQLVTAILSE